MLLKVLPLPIHGLQWHIRPERDLVVAHLRVPDELPNYEPFLLVKLVHFGTFMSLFYLNWYLCVSFFDFLIQLSLIKAILYIDCREGEHQK